MNGTPSIVTSTGKMQVSQPLIGPAGTRMGNLVEKGTEIRSFRRFPAKLRPIAALISFSLTSQTPP